MSKIKTQEEFLLDAYRIHGNKFDYSESVYIKAKSKIKIMCNTCQKYFNQNPNVHICQKQGCPYCAGKVYNTNDFIDKAKKINGNKCSYSLVDYINGSTPIKLICNRCARIYYQKPSSHLAGKTCKYCGKTRVLNTEIFIKNSKKINGEKFNYSLVEYIGNKIKIKLICNSCNKIFCQRPDSHISQKQGCPNCRKNKKLTTEDFISRSKKIHGDLYDYSSVVYKGIDEKVKIICNVHGIFHQLPSSHLHQKCGCPICRNSKGELAVKSWLENNQIKFMQEYKFPDCRNILELPFDFYLPDYNFLIEYDGEQHFNASKLYGGEKRLINTLKLDKIKTEYCKDNNINLLRIKYNENIEEKLNGNFTRREEKSI